MKIKRDIEKTVNVWEREFKKGYTAYMILLMLHEKPRYGYEVKQCLEESTEGKVSFKESGIYQILKTLSKKEFLDSYWGESPHGPKRKYYKMTESGDQLLSVFTERCIMPLQAALNNALGEYLSQMNEKKAAGRAK
ncbi:MAG: PadR family transcriptional regulator [Candidatus Cloacimonetes bacterium]|nr:PadR family transcriptional regulator [Candidatus Cloacimonadota bacterium]